MLHLSVTVSPQLLFHPLNSYVYWESHAFGVAVTVVPQIVTVLLLLFITILDQWVASTEPLSTLQYHAGSTIISTSCLVIISSHQSPCWFIWYHDIQVHSHSHGVLESTHVHILVLGHNHEQPLFEIASPGTLGELFQNWENSHFHVKTQSQSG